VGPVAGDAVNPSMGAWSRHPCRSHPCHRTHPAFDRFPLLLELLLELLLLELLLLELLLGMLLLELLLLGMLLLGMLLLGMLLLGMLLLGMLLLGMLLLGMLLLVGADRWSARGRIPLLRNGLDLALLW